MQCPTCGALVNGAFCEYCGAKMPAERVEAQTIHAQNVTVNNYYYDRRSPSGKSGVPSPMMPEAQTDARPSALSSSSPKSRTITLLLCIFLGFFGAHRFYSGRFLLGVAYLFTLGLLGIGWLVDIALILAGRMRDGEGRTISEW